MLSADQAPTIRTAMDGGCGWVVFHSDDVAAGDKQAMTAIARSLGEESQRDGGALWTVAPRAGAGTFSVTDEEAGLHTDAQYHHQPEPRFLLFCVVPAECGGGVNRLLRAADLIEDLDHTGALTPADTERLRRESWYWKVPEVFQTASTPTAPGHAVLGPDGTVRWRRDNLSPKDAQQKRTADRFQDYLESHPAVETVLLGAGDVLYCDNKRALHGRTAFRDKRRLLYRTRLW